MWLATLLAPALAADDPWLWLEEVGGPNALAWVEVENRRTTDALATGPAFEALRDRIRDALDSTDRIPTLTGLGDGYASFWRDRDHPRGIWRRTTLASVISATGGPEWELLLDLDALAEAEGESWVWQGAECLPPDEERCLIRLSRGGADASVVREFDVASRTFVADGFTLPEAKSRVAWIDADTIFVGTDFPAGASDPGPGSLTESGYPRLVKQWSRGTPLSDAVLVAETDPTHMGITGLAIHTPGFEREIVQVNTTIFDARVYLRTTSGLVQVEKPDHVALRIHRRWALFEPREPWNVDGITHPAGSLLAADLGRWMKGKREVTVLFTPTRSVSLAKVVPTEHHLLLELLDDVATRVEVLTAPAKHGPWARAELPGVPELGNTSVWADDPDRSDAYWMRTTDFLTPPRLYLGAVGEGVPERIDEEPAFFDAAGLTVTQHFATSEDGTRVPYFQVGPAAPGPDAPTLLTGYGGFQNAMRPRYQPEAGIGWLERGGVYAVANIRGGGEYGPEWHQAALREKRHAAYEDFVAVARDLVARGVTTSDRLGAMGGSNGGLLVGNMYTTYPDDFGAIVCRVPLLDMERYTQLLAGASWIAEYGDPAVPADWEFLRRYSPYHNLGDGPYPPLLLTTSTRDDRVHPGHARKMAAALRAAGTHDVSYYENVEGGHGGSANNAQKAFMDALVYTFLADRLQ